ncbi:uncharacterized protein LTR77_009396 [Saxophila tyrrhenica]|uniref:Uncharacterized protein n=1 Tax=Saxophila tyrrhenica TaxID=1690608 RepID=A0AAV9NZN9_9PEZI|nr:hypothetical protein LTR77_009396 [Saxophila tyrrhenica]
MEETSLESATERLAIRPKTVDFPLPREIRDFIYGLLLSGEKVQDEPYHTRNQGSISRNRSAAHTYSFQPSVLQLNKTISREASEELRRSNCFVVVSYKWPGLEDLIHTCDVPIVTQDNSAVARFQHHSMRIHLRHRDISPKDTSCQTRSFLLLLRDMPLFCRTIRWASLDKSAAGRMVLNVKDPESPVEELNVFYAQTSRNVFCTNVDFRSTTRKPLSPTLEASLVRAVEDVRMPGQKVVVRGAINLSETTTHLRSTAGAPYVFITALAWDLLDIAQALMKTANTFAAAGQHAQAAQRYLDIIAPCRDSFLFTPSEVLFFSDCATPVVLLFRVLMNAAAAYGFERLRASDMTGVQGADDIAHHISYFISQFDDRNKILGYGDAERATWFLVTPALHVQLLLLLSKDQETEKLRSLVAAFGRMRQYLPGSVHLAHDEALVRSLLDGSTVSGTGIMEQTSACALPPPLFEFEIPQHTVRPQLKGWVVEDQREKLMEMERKQGGVLG